MGRAKILLFLLIATSCGDATGILVEVRSTDLSVPSDIDALRFSVVADTGRRLDQTFDIADSWPHSLTILPADSNDGSVTVTVTALKAGAFVARRVVRASFESGSTRRVEVVLTRDCVGVMCADGVDCVNGMCVGVAPLDGGVPDGGRRDAGRTDSGGIDGGGSDSGSDSGFDSGPGDAGLDASVDGGPPGCVDSACVGIVVISEFRTRNGPAGASDEFVEIYNRSATRIDVGNVDLRYPSSTGVESRRATIPAGTIIEPGGYLLLGSAGFSGTPDVPERWSAGLADAGGTVFLRAGTDEIDLVGYGTAVAPNVEGAAFSPGSDPCEVSCERKARAGSNAASMSSGGADETASNARDSGNNSADFVQRSTAQPQSAASPIEPPS